jgi:spore maturation protein CgeB
LRVLLVGSYLGYNLEGFVASALEELGCKIKFVGYYEHVRGMATPTRILITRSKRVRQLIEPITLRKFNNAVRRIAIEFEPDLLLAIKGEALLPKTVDWFSHSLGAITALWFPDDPRYFRSLSSVVAPYYDNVFTASQRFVRAYRDEGVAHVEHLPFACEPSVHRHVTLTNSERSTFASDVCFVGTFSLRRSKIVHSLERAGFRVRVWGSFWRYFKRSPNVGGPLWGPDLAKAFSAATFVLNVHDDADLRFKPNMRVFEAAGCGSLLLTDKAFGLEHFFTPGKEILCYNDETDLLELAKEYSKRSSEGEEIAAQGNLRAYREHTYNHRLTTLLKSI